MCLQASRELQKSSRKSGQNSGTREPRAGKKQCFREFLLCSERVRGPLSRIFGYWVVSSSRFFAAGGRQKTPERLWKKGSPNHEKPVFWVPRGWPGPPWASRADFFRILVDLGVICPSFLAPFGDPFGSLGPQMHPIATRMPLQSRFWKAFWWIFPEDAFLVGPGERFGRGRHVIRPHRRSPNAVFRKHTLAPKGSILESLWEAFGRLWATFGRLGGAPGRFFPTGGAVWVLLQ